MKITADTNVLVRAAVLDEPMQSAVAAAALLEAEIVPATVPALCEFVWVLMRGYKRNAAEVAAALRKLVEDQEAWSTGLQLRPVSPFSKEGEISPMASSLSKAGAPAAAFSRASIATPSR